MKMNYDEALMKKRIADMDCDEVNCAHCGSKIGSQTPVVFDIVNIQPAGHKRNTETKFNEYGERLFFCNNVCAEAEQGDNCHVCKNTVLYNDKIRNDEEIVFTDFFTYNNRQIHSSEYSFRAIAGLTITKMGYGSQRFNSMVDSAGEKGYINTMPNDPMEPLARQNWAPRIQKDVLSLRAYFKAVSDALGGGQ